MLKTISLAVTAETINHKASEIAVQLTKLVKGRLCCSFIRPDPKTAIPFVGEGLTAETIQTICNNAEQEGLEASHRAERHLDQLTNTQKLIKGQNYHFHTLLGAINDHVGRRARLSDLAVCPQPSNNALDADDILQDLLFKSGRLLMMVPAETESVGKHALIAWNGRAECARAIGAVIPLLEKAEKVTAIQIGEIGEERPSINDLNDYLNAFDLQHKTEVIQAKSGKIAPQIHDYAQSIGADYIVIGAYSHARWREMILGGVTHWLTSHSEIPVVMSH